METLFQVAVLLFGLILRLGIPLGVTMLLGWVLRRLDAQWQREGEALRPAATASEEDLFGLPCWQIRDCPAAVREACPAYRQSEIPCWELLRGPDGRLQQKCLSCQVFRSAPMPVAA